MPMSISIPIIAGTPIGVPVATSRPIAPVAAKGIEMSRISGWTRDRKVPTRSMKTMAMAASMARPSEENASDWSAETPPISAVAPSGSFRALILDWSWAVTAPVLSPVGLAVTVAERAPSMRVLWTGPATVRIVARSPSFAGPAGVGTGRARSAASEVTGWADLTTTSRSVSPIIALPLVVPRTAWATTWPRAAWL